MNDHTGGDPDDGRETLAEQIADQYLTYLQTGGKPDRVQWRLMGPDLGDLLESKLELVEIMHGAAKAALAPAENSTLDPLPVAVTHVDSMQGHPKKIGRYEIRRELGRGASGIVYEAYDSNQTRLIALKVFRGDPKTDLKGAQRFRSEAITAAKLKHPNIVELYDVSEYEGKPYLTMEFVSGGSLAARLTSGAIHHRIAAEWVCKLTAALECMHGLNTIHRDVKPLNILLQVTSSSELANDDVTKEPKITDFGLAHRPDRDASQTRQGDIIGTWAYMSPEQAKGSSLKVDRRSDVYSLGVVFYHMIAGRTPFPSDTGVMPIPEQIRHITDVEPPRPSTFNEKIPRELDAICLTAMAKEPAERFATAAEFGEALRRWQNNEHPGVTLPTACKRLSRWSKRNRVLAGTLAAAALAVAIVSGILGTTTWLQYQRAAVESQRVAVLAQAQTQIRIWMLLDSVRRRLQDSTSGRRSDIESMLGEVASLRTEIASPEVIERINIQARSLYAVSLANPEIQSDSRDFPLDWPNIRCVAVAPDGHWMAIGTQLGPIRWDRGQALEHSGVQENQRQPRLAFAPDGNYLVYAPAVGGIVLFDGRTLAPTQHTWKPDAKSEVLAIGFPPNGKSIVVCCRDGSIQPLSLPELQPGPTAKVSSLDHPLAAAAFSHNMAMLVAGNDQGHVACHEMRDHDEHRLPDAKTQIEALAWAHDNQVVAVGARDGTVQLVEPRSGSRAHRLVLRERGVSNIAFSPDGRWVLAGRNAMTMWDKATGEQILTGRHVPWGFSRAGTTFAGASTMGVAFCSIENPDAMREMRGHQVTTARLAWSSDSGHLASIDYAYQIRVWNPLADISSQAIESPQVAGMYSDNGSIALSDDGQIVAFASGGETESKFRMFDVTTGKAIVQHEFGGGFEHLACIDGRRFRLVRDALNAHDNNCRTVMYDIEVGKPLEEPRLVREPAAKDIRRNLSSTLTPDGRFYCWVGPRKPEGEHRVEVFDLIERKLVKRVALPTLPKQPQPGAALSDDGRTLTTVNHFQHMSYDLSTGEGPIPVRQFVIAQSINKNWLVFTNNDATTSAHFGAVLCRHGSDVPWLLLSNRDLSPPHPIRFSPDSGYLAWGSASGTITVADLRKLLVKVDDFERKYLSK